MNRKVDKLTTSKGSVANKLKTERDRKQSRLDEIMGKSTGHVWKGRYKMKK